MLNQLRDEMPSGPNFAALNARKMTLVAQARSLLGHGDEVDARYDAAHQAAEAAHAEDVLVTSKTCKATD